MSGWWHSRFDSAVEPLRPIIVRSTGAGPGPRAAGSAARVPVTAATGARHAVAEHRTHHDMKVVRQVQGAGAQRDRPVTHRDALQHHAAMDELGAGDGLRALPIARPRTVNAYTSLVLPGTGVSSARSARRSWRIGGNTTLVIRTRGSSARDMPYPAAATLGRRRGLPPHGPRRLTLEVLEHLPDHRRALADRGGDPLHGAVAQVADGEHPRHAGLELAEARATEGASPSASFASTASRPVFT